MVSYQVSPLATRASLHAAGAQMVLESSQVSLPVRYCKSPVVTPYWEDKESHDEVCRSSIGQEPAPRILAPAPIVCPEQVLDAAGELVVVVVVVELPKLIDVTGGATS